MNGFLPGARGTLMLDLVVCAMALVIPLQIWSIAQARAGKWQLHRLVQITTSIVLLITLIAFEVDIRINGWRHLAETSAYYDTLVFPALYVHLFFAISTPFVWGYTLIKAMRQFGNPVTPNDDLSAHRRRGKLSFWFLTGTTITGWIFYYLAFIA